MFQKLGQHFLTNQSAIKKIISALELRPDDTVIEIGPGRGALTFPLLKKCQRLIAIEKDPKLGLGVKGVGNSKHLEVVIGDAPKTLPDLIKTYDLRPMTYKLVGNIPYYITGKLLRILSELKNKPTLVVLMVQKEVAERLIAKPPKMNLLAAATQFWAEPEILFTLKPEDFNPLPKVESAIIKLKTKDARQETKETENYYKSLRILFKQPRKTILNNLQTGLKLPKNKIENALRSLKIDPNSRPQNLSIKQIKQLTVLPNLFTF